MIFVDRGLKNESTAKRSVCKHVQKAKMKHLKVSMSQGIYVNMKKERFMVDKQDVKAHKQSYKKTCYNGITHYICFLHDVTYSYGESLQRKNEI